MSQLEELRAVVRQFVSERGWDQHHNPKNLAIAMTLEAGEVLEHFQWLSEADSFKLTPEALEAAITPKTKAIMLAHTLGNPFNLAKVKGEGRKGRIQKEDVQAYVKAAIQRAESAPAGVAGGAGLGVLPWPKVDFAKFGPDRKSVV